MGLWLAMFISGLSLQNLSAREDSQYPTEEYNQEKNPDSDSTFWIALEDLYFDQGNLLLNVAGTPQSVQSLQRVGGRWLATTVEPIVLCGMGHNACKECRQCHLKVCRYYIRPCRLWK